MANNFHTILLESPLYDDLKTFSAQIENQTSLKTRTTIVVSNGRYTFYQIHFIKHNL